MKMSPDTEEAVRCAASTCSCVCFQPGSVQLRSCDRCGHSWVAHALEKLQFQAPPPSSCGPVEVALPGLVFDLSSLVLYGAQAVPVRLKILLDRLYSILTPEQVGHILRTLGWSLGDYVRGYMLQYPSGKVLDRWLMVTPEEELLILKQFLRFGETRPIVELMTLQCLAAVNHISNPELNPGPKSCQSNVITIIERNAGTPGEFKNTRGDSRSETDVCRLKNHCPADHKDTDHRFENSAGGLSLLLPFHFPSSTFHSLVSPTKDFVPLSKITCLRRPNGTKLTETQRPQEGRRQHENYPILQQPKDEPSIKIKADPDKPNLSQSMWHQKPCFHNDQDLDLYRSLAKQENTSSHIPTSSPFYPSISSSSSSPPKLPQKLQGSSSYSLSPLPSFSSSFLCPLPASSFSSSLRPLPSSLCALPSLSSAGGRKGRVCCGVCGKSFYDKGTLKIHYNAVHLKIKHRCTVAGCTMVFSSLRSRNRHSANPNPRLHTGSSREAHTNRNSSADPQTSLHSETMIHKNARKNMHNTHKQICNDKDISNALWQQDDDAQTIMRVHTLKNGFNCRTSQQQGCQENTPPPADSSPSSPPLSRTLDQITNQNVILSDSTFRTEGPSPPPLLPARSASSLGSPPSLIPLVAQAAEKTELCGRFPSPHPNHKSPTSLPSPTSINISSHSGQPVSHDYGVPEEKQGKACTSPLSIQQHRWESGDPMPKKKSRKSSMPVKIEREKTEGRRNNNEEEC